MAHGFFRSALQRQAGNRRGVLIGHTNPQGNAMASHRRCSIFPNHSARFRAGPGVFPDAGRHAPGKLRPACVAFG